MRILERATTGLRRIVDVALLALIVVVLLAVVVAKGAPLVGRQTIVIGGESMEPAIPLGSAIVVKPVDPAELSVGDVVSMQVGSERATYTHRIVALVDRPDGRWIRTKGDGNAAPDPTLVPATAVIGRVEIAIPLIGYLVALLSLPVGVIFVLGLAATLLAIAWLLESLEPERVVIRRLAATGDEPATPGLPDGSAPAPARPADLAASRGEPIAARPIAARPIRIGLPSAAGLSTALAGSSGPSIPSSARPTVRQQLGERREARRRRARWLGRGGRPSSD
jgi:signal peptidase